VIDLQVVSQSPFTRTSLHFGSADQSLPRATWEGGAHVVRAATRSN
jgi:hypothetical protein